MPKLQFSAIGLNHGHIYGQTRLLLNAGAELMSFFAEEDDLAAAYAQAFPQARRVSDKRAILEDQTIELVISASIPDVRASLGIEVMRHGKDYMADKPGFTTLEQLEEARRVQAETGRIYSICFSERFENAATVRAGELAQAGAIGQVVQTIGLGPHRSNPGSRPAWFFKKSRYGGILNDIASHQADQFLFFTGAISAEVVSAQVANYRYPHYPEFEDFGDVQLRGFRPDGLETSGYIRVDWYTPDGLDSWGDGRLTILGTEGFMEIRKNIDIAGRSGGNHLFLIDQSGTHYIDCSDLELPYGRQLIADIRDRSETAMPQAHCFLASELVLRAQLVAHNLTK